jgi:uncharacterized protein YdaU (DUF1376 family)
MPLYPGDFLASTAEWTGEERGLYLLLLTHQWSLGSLPADPSRVCRLVGWSPNLFDDCWHIVGTKFQEREGRLYNRRLEEHRERARALSAKNVASGRRGASARWRTNGENDGERHEHRHGETDGERHLSVTGTARGNPTQPNPTQTMVPVDALALEVGVQGAKPRTETSRDVLPALNQATQAVPVSNGRKLRSLEGAALAAKVAKFKLARIDEGHAVELLQSHYVFDPAEVHREFKRDASEVRL